MEAAQDENILNCFIEQQETVILCTASRVTGHFVTKSDDEWSIALSAFVEAVKAYDLKRGSFFNFAKMVIQRRLIDYIRQQKKYRNEITVNPVLFDSDSASDENDHIGYAVTKKSLESHKQESLAFEINAVNEILMDFGFTFFDLIKSSPKAAKTKTACVKAISFCLGDPMVTQVLEKTKLLPVKIIENNTKVPRKIIERHRKYIIAAIVILSGEYQELAEYLRTIREEMKR
ncbi:sigma factor [Lacrimispora amygdalina]|uniref:sigma factor n=1 Tax=Lacrimispora amygdalina TaxID=253257 RepID=UPI001407E3BB|nr:sigma factor [Lacrimispora amygdalina]